MSTFTAAFTSNRHRAAGITKRALQAPHSLRQRMHGHAVVDQIQAAGQPRLTKYTAPLTAILGAILIASTASVMGIMPDLSGTPLSPTGNTTLGATVSGGANAEMLSADSSLAAKLDWVQAQPPGRQAELLNILGVSCLSRGDTAGATKCFRRALDANPQLIAARNNLGTALLQAGDNSGARTAFGATLQLQPQNLFARQQLDRLGK